MNTPLIKSEKETYILVSVFTRIAPSIELPFSLINFTVNVIPLKFLPRMDKYRISE